MKTETSSAVLLILALLLAPAGASLAGDANTTADASGDDGILALDANQGSGVQVNTDDWYDMENALSGDGAQNVYTEGAANTGTGTQDNSTNNQDGWVGMDSANSGSGAQVLDSSNSNGGDRNSNDSLLNAGSYASVGNSALEASVSGNAVETQAVAAEANSAMTLSGDSRFSGLAGVSAIALGSGSNASQNVGVNVSAQVDGF